jgi:hypothetical protein
MMRRVRSLLLAHPLLPPLLRTEPLRLPFAVATPWQSALLGCCMYQLIQLSDLESDYINPHDATSEWVGSQLT